MDQHISSERNPQTKSFKERIQKWQERSILEAIRAKGYEPDEILIRRERHK